MNKKYIGTRDFYRNVLAIVLPIMVQNGITSFVNMLDNIMVGKVGTLEMTAVSVVNQLMFVFNLFIFGAVSGAGIFGAQYYGKGDYVGHRNTFRFKIICGLILSVLAITIFGVGDEWLIGLYLKGETDPAMIAETMGYATDYLKVMLVGLVPFAISQCYSGSLREGGETVLPMNSGIIAVLVNLIGNYILIFGHFGAPRMGVVGAAIATVISRYVELLFLVIVTGRNKDKYPFILDAFKSLRVPADLSKKIIVKGMPLLINEGAWSLGLAIISQVYSWRGTEILAADNICTTFWRLFSVSFMAVGQAVAIIIGQELGANKFREAKEDCPRLIAFAIFISLIMGVLFAITAPFIPRLYNTSDEIRTMARNLILICSLVMPIDAFVNSCYFTIRSGGQVWITILFDSAFVWTVQLVLAFILVKFTSMSIEGVFAVVQFSALSKCVLGYVLLKKGTWLRNIVDTDQTVEA